MLVLCFHGAFRSTLLMCMMVCQHGMNRDPCMETYVGEVKQGVPGDKGVGGGGLIAKLLIVGDRSEGQQSGKGRGGV